MSSAIWNGHISFGLVEIPVTLTKAEETREQLRFSLVDRRDHAPVGYLRVNKRTGEEVPASQIAKGYALESGEYVLFSTEELELANPEATHTVEIVDFVDATSIHPAYFATPYYLEPARKQASKAYALLREALVRTRKVAIASVVLRTREYVAALMPWGPALVLVLMRYEHELRKPDELEVPPLDLEEVGVRQAEIEMAEQLVTSMARRWEPERYHDEYFRDVMALVERKVQAGQSEPVEVQPAAPAAAPSPPEDLMALLKDSVERRASEAGAEGRAPEPHRRRPERRRGRRAGPGRTT